MHIGEFTEQMNQLARAGTPFLFMVDFEMRNAEVLPLSSIEASDILYDVNGVTNAAVPQYKTSRLNPDASRAAIGNGGINLHKHPISADLYREKFQCVHDHLLLGDSYLTNLTIKTEISIPVSLRDLFHASKARYKLLYRDQFLVFSPEIFVQVEGGIIRSFPMKGTIDANIPNAVDVILRDEKELAEHVTIVDLIRNDLSAVAHDVTVERFRYVEKIVTTDRELLQVSSGIRGTVSGFYAEHLGDLFVALLPAGSVSGAPKKKTCEIIAVAEGEARGWYSGVFGIFDGQKLDSGVMIRFIEHTSGKYYYRSGGGITARSDVNKEFQEAIDKIYVPVY